jgi:hypothetical protein
MTKNPPSNLVLKDHRLIERLWKSLPFESSPTFDFHISRKDGGEINVQMSTDGNEEKPGRDPLKPSASIRAGLYDLGW